MSTSLSDAARMDPLFLWALGISSVGHALILGATLLIPGWGRWLDLHPLQLVYERHLAQEGQWAAEELRRAHTRRLELPNPSSLPQGALAAGAPGGRGLGEAIAIGISNSLSQIRIGEGQALSLPYADASSGAWSAAADLTNVVAAAQGNPVLLSYFSAIREQIQETANEHAWLPKGATTQGTICVGFIVNRLGQIQSASIIAERSSPSPLLRDVALRIIKSAAPFPPFPPSFQDSSKAILIPIEFVLGS